MDDCGPISWDQCSNPERITGNACPPLDDMSQGHVYCGCCLGKQHSVAKKEKFFHAGLCTKLGEALKISASPTNT